MEVSDNPGLRKDRSDPTLICTAFKKNRFYLFTKKNPDESKRFVLQWTDLEMWHDVLLCLCVSASGDNDRDVFNEKPSKEEQLAATQVMDYS